MVGIVILNYIEWDDTVNCIRNVLSDLPKLDLHIYVIDNASPNPAPEYFEEIVDNDSITFIQNVSNSGYSSGNNVGIEKALDDGCDAILIANSDIFFHQNSIPLMYEYLRKNCSVGIVGPRILSSDGSIADSNIFMRTGMREKYCVRTSFSVFFKSIKTAYYGIGIVREFPFEVYAVSGCCLMLSRECAKIVTPFDENTFLYEEELILGITMEQAGYKTVCLPESVVTHFHAQSSKHVKAFSFACAVKSELYYCKKYLNATIISVIPLYSIRTLSYLVRALKCRDFRRNIRHYFRSTICQLIAK